MVFGPDARSLFVTLLLIIVPVIIFCVCVARHLRHEFSPHNSGYAILAVAILFTIHVSSANFFLFYCSFFIYFLSFCTHSFSLVYFKFRSPNLMQATTTKNILLTVHHVFCPSSCIPVMNQY